MAREEADRENLLRDATALVERVEFVLQGCEASTVVGFRREGAASFYFGADPAYHFNAEGALRRAYLAGQLLKAERGQLVTLRRNRTPGEVQLVAHTLAPEETNVALDQLQQLLDRLQSDLRANRYQLVGQVPSEANVIARVQSWLDSRQSLVVAQRPHVG